MRKRTAIPFSKFSGCGNDFIIIDDREHLFPEDNKELVRSMCHRHKGIGADGVLLLNADPQGSYLMTIYNADGTQAEMCGNGLRCLAKFIDSVDRPEEKFTIKTPYGEHHVDIAQGTVAAGMGAPTEIEWNRQLVIAGTSYTYHFLNTGVPHAVFFVDQLDRFPIDTFGKEVRRHPRFAPRGSNVTCVELHGKQQLSFRTYERGVEGETLACGTGAAAAALAAAHLHSCPSPIQVKTRSGEDLEIAFNTDFSQVTTKGPAQAVFHGVFTIA